MFLFNFLFLIKIFIQFLKVTLQLQLLQNIGSFLHVIQNILVAYFAPNSLYLPFSTCNYSSPTSLCGYIFSFYNLVRIYQGFPGLNDKESACQCRRPEFDPWVRKIPWRREWLSTPVFLPGKSHGQRSLVGYSPWGRKESDTIEWLNNKLPYSVSI